jgi:hypothetical protein
MDNLLKISRQLPYQQEYARIYQLQQKERRLMKNRAEKGRAKAKQEANQLPQQ